MTTTLGPKLGHGRTSDVYAWGEDAIKLFPASTSLKAIEREAHDAGLVHSLGVPSLEVRGLAEADGRTGIVFERLAGENLTTISERNILGLPEVCRTLARLHVAVHAAPAPELIDVRELAVSVLDRPQFAALTTSERAWLVDHLRSLPAGDSVLHLDYHPQNVHEHHDGHAVIDWEAASSGAPAADVAMSRLLMTEAELFPGTPPLKIVLYTLARRVMLHFYLAEYRRLTGLTMGEVERWQTAARVLRLGLLNVASERSRLLGRIRAAIADASE